MNDIHLPPRTLLLASSTWSHFEGYVYVVFVLHNRVSLCRQENDVGFSILRLEFALVLWNDARVVVVFFLEASITWIGSDRHDGWCNMALYSSVAMTRVTGTAGPVAGKENASD